MPRRTTIYVSFLAAVALVAAAVGDPCVETLANTGAFGAGYADGNHLGVVPAAIAALTFLFGLAILRAIDGVRATRAGHAERLRWATETRSSDDARRDFAHVFGFQLASVYGMEWLEAAFVHHASPTGLAWLGAPAPISLALHAAIGAATLWAMRHIVRWLLEGVLELVRVAAAACVRLDAPRPGTSRSVAPRRRAYFRAQAPHVRDVGGRAPPRRLLAPTR